MDREQYLLGKLAEEAAELAQIAMKAQQFGLNEVYTGDGNTLTNGERIHLELWDLFGIIQMLNDECDFKYAHNTARLMMKIEKVNKYSEYSRELGKLNG